MKKYPKVLQTDQRGQIVIPKEVRDALGIEEGTAFFAYLINNEGIFLKKIEDKALSEQPELKEFKEKAQKLGVQKKNIEQSEKMYEKKTRGEFEDV